MAQSMRSISSLTSGPSRRCEGGSVCYYTSPKASNVPLKVLAIASRSPKRKVAMNPVAARASATQLKPRRPRNDFIQPFAFEDDSHRQFDILGLAQSMVDVTTEEPVDEESLRRLSVKKGGRRVLESVDERSSVLATLDAAELVTKITPGGSLANTLVAISRLSQASGRSRLNVALASSCSSDAVGQFFAASLRGAGVAVLPTSEEPGHTGTVFVLASPDGSRSFLSFFHSERLEVSGSLRQAISQSRLVVIEGYLWELPNASAAIAEVVAIARASGVQVALTAGDPGVVSRHREEILGVLKSAGKDILFFANREEACELQGKARACCARVVAAEMGSLCSIAVVTDGSAGSYVSCMGQVHAVPPVEAPHGGAVVDTCGAGDGYAAGFCYALMTGHDCATAGMFASNTAARIIARHGAQLLEEEAEELVEMLPKRITTVLNSLMPPTLRV